MPDSKPQDHYDGREHRRVRDNRAIDSNHQKDADDRVNARKAPDGSHVSGKKKAGAPAMTGSVICETPRRRRKSSDRAPDRSRPLEKEKSPGRSRPPEKEKSPCRSRPIKKGA